MSFEEPLWIVKSSKDGLEHVHCIATERGDAATVLDRVAAETGAAVSVSMESRSLEAKPGSLVDVLALGVHKGRVQEVRQVFFKAVAHKDGALMGDVSNTERQKIAARWNLDHKDQA